VLKAQALCTNGAAASTGEERIKGRLAPGHLADFTVLDEDLLRVDPRRHASLGIRSTWVAGKCVRPQLPPALPVFPGGPTSTVGSHCTALRDRAGLVRR
jgi:hypothetical protein